MLQLQHWPANGKRRVRCAVAGFGAELYQLKHSENRTMGIQPCLNGHGLGTPTVKGFVNRISRASHKISPRCRKSRGEADLVVRMRAKTGYVFVNMQSHASQTLRNTNYPKCFWCCDSKDSACLLKDPKEYNKVKQRTWVLVEHNRHSCVSPTLNQVPCTETHWRRAEGVQVALDSLKICSRLLKEFH